MHKQLAFEKHKTPLYLLMEPWSFLCWITNE